jgi:hypothetical protein
MAKMARAGPMVAIAPQRGSWWSCSLLRRSRDPAGFDEFRSVSMLAHFFDKPTKTSGDKFYG